MSVCVHVCKYSVCYLLTDLRPLGGWQHQQHLLHMHTEVLLHDNVLTRISSEPAAL